MICSIGRKSLTRFDIIKRLCDLGFISIAERGDGAVSAAVMALAPEVVHEAVCAYQRMHGLVADGDIGPDTIRSFMAPRLCSHPDRMAMHEQSKWPETELRYCFVKPWQNADMGMVCGAFAWAWDQLATACGVKGELVTNRGEAHILIDEGPIDRAGGMLAFSEMADGTMVPKTMKFDSLETWSFGESPPQYHLDLGRVCLHELGHVLGVPHLDVGALMAPTYSMTIRTPQEPDVKELQARYGPPRFAAPAPTDGEHIVTLIVSGKITAAAIPGFKVEKLP